MNNSNTFQINIQSNYLVNNSFKCALQHKRISFDTQFYSLIHKKIFRKTIIQRKFEETQKNQCFSPQSYTKGFKGKTLSNFTLGIHKRTTLKTRINESNDQPVRMNTSFRESKPKWKSPKSFSSRPNMMCNLSLYRKGWKKCCFQTKSNSLSIIRKEKKTKTQTINEGPIKIRIKTVV